MNRRQFLRVLPAAVAGVALTDPSRLLEAPKLAFHPRAFTFVMKDLDVTRFDVLFGWSTLRPEHACRVVADSNYVGDVIDGQVVRREARIVPIPLPEDGNCGRPAMSVVADAHGPLVLYDYRRSSDESAANERDHARHHLQIGPAAVDAEPDPATLQG